MEHDEGIEISIFSRSTFVVFFDDFKDEINLVDAEVSGIDEIVELMEFVPYFPFEDSFWSDGETIAAYEVGLAFVAEIGVALEESPEGPYFRRELSVLIFEHADCPAGVDDQHLHHTLSTYLPSVLPCDRPHPGSFPACVQL
jgi:hypothetical protein